MANTQETPLPDNEVVPAVSLLSNRLRPWKGPVLVLAGSVVALLLCAMSHLFFAKHAAVVRLQIPSDFLTGKQPSIRERVDLLMRPAMLSLVFQQEAVKKLRLEQRYDDRLAAVQQGLQVTTQEGRNTITVQMTSRNPKEAIILAKALATVFQDHLVASVVSSHDQRLKELEQEHHDAKVDLARWQKQVEQRNRALAEADARIRARKKSELQDCIAQAREHHKRAREELAEATRQRESFERALRAKKTTPTQVKVQVDVEKAIANDDRVRHLTSLHSQLQQMLLYALARGAPSSTRSIRNVRSQLRTLKDQLEQRKQAIRLAWARKEKPIVRKEPTEELVRARLGNRVQELKQRCGSLQDEMQALMASAAMLEQESPPAWVGLREEAERKKLQSQVQELGQQLKQQQAKLRSVSRMRVSRGVTQLSRESDRSWLVSAGISILVLLALGVGLWWPLRRKSLSVPSPSRQTPPLEQPAPSANLTPLPQKTERRGNTGPLLGMGSTRRSLAKKPGAEPLPGYHLIAPLGRGGFGEVWKCEAPGGLLKAIKFVQANLNLGERGPAQDELQAIQIVKSIRHPFLLSMERIEVIGGELIIVLELADQHLGDVFRREQRVGRSGIPQDQLLGYLQEAAEVLDLMNARYHVQHLDIKPQNLFVVCNHLKVGDFGLVTSLRKARPDQPNTPHISGVTPPYAAPELFHATVSRHSDQYSLAVVYQELLTGSLPFSGKNSRQLMMQHTTCEPDLTPLPREERGAIRRALSKNPQQRFPSCGDFIHALLSGQTEVVATTFGHVSEGVDRTTAPGTASAETRYGTPRVPPSKDRLSSESTSRGLHTRFSTVLEMQQVKTCLRSFRETWKAQEVEATEESFLYRMETPRTFWQRDTGSLPPQESTLQICITLSQPPQQGLLESAQGTSGNPRTIVCIEIEPLRCGVDQREELLKVVGPLLVESVRTHLQTKNKVRRDERLVWHYPLQIQPVQDDGSLGEAIECQGKDISLNGIGFYLFGDLTTDQIHVHLPETPISYERTVAAQVVRRQDCGEGWQEVGAVLLGSANGEPSHLIGATALASS